MCPWAWLLLYPGVFFSSWLGGLRVGLLATAMSTQSSSTFRGIISLFHEHVRKANQQATESLAAKAANDQLETRIRELTSELVQSNELPQTSELRFRELVEALPRPSA